MSRLSEILGVPEGQEFTYTNNSYICKIENGVLKRKEDETWVNLNSVLCLMIKYPENIKIIPTKPKLSEQQRIAIKGRIADGWKYIVSEDDWTYCYKEKPWNDNKKSDYFTKRLERSLANEAVFDFVENGKCFYLPDLIGDEENE